MDTAALLTDFDHTTKGLLEQISAFRPGQTNVAPPIGGWTATQVAEHLVKAGGDLPALFQDAVEPARRPVDMHVAVIRDTFLDFSTKMTAPPFTEPGPVHYTKDEVLAKLADLMTAIRDAAATSDLAMLCSAFEFPTLGNLTRLEWVHFVMYHTQRHTRQLENIQQALS